MLNKAQIIPRMSYTEPRHPINFVSQRTGLSPYLIRAWERRYRAVVPERSGTNRRLYSDADVNRFKLIAQVIALGHSIGQIADLEDDRLREIIRTSAADRQNQTEPVGPRSDGAAAELLQQAKTSVMCGDADALLAALTHANVRIAQPVLLSDVIAPLLHWIGQQWHAGALRISHEHLASEVVRDFLAGLRRQNQARKGAPRIVVATPSGEAHEFGALMAAITASADGWQDVYLGPNTPWQEIAESVITNDATAVAIGLAQTGNDPEVQEELNRLRRYLPETIPVFVGGPGVASQRPRLDALGLRCTDTLEDFREALGALRN